MDASDVTLAIPCYNVACVLPETLSAVRELNSPPARIICIDDGSTDGTTNVVRNTEDIELVLHEENRGLAATRNTALHHTETAGLAMIDADVVVDSDWLSELTKELSTTGAVAVGGRTEERVDTIGDEWRQLHYSSDHGTEPKDVGWVFGANALYETAALQDVGGWDEQYQTNYEDVDLGERLEEAAYTLRYIPSARAEHNRTDSIIGAVRGRWNWFYRGHREPESVIDIIKRAPYHSIFAVLGLWKELQNLNFHLMPISVLMPIFWVYYDIETYMNG